MERDKKSTVGRILLGILSLVALLAAAYYVFARVAARIAKDSSDAHRAKLNAGIRRSREKKRDDSGISDFRFEDDDFSDCFAADDDSDGDDVLEVVMCGAKDKAEDVFDAIADAADNAKDDIADVIDEIKEDIADAADDISDAVDGVADALSEDSLDRLLES